MNKLIGRRYNIYEKLGHGNFGSVYKGKHSKHNTDVAIKLESIFESNLVKISSNNTGLRVINPGE